MDCDVGPNHERAVSFDSVPGQLDQKIFILIHLSNESNSATVFFRIVIFDRSYFDSSAYKRRINYDFSDCVNIVRFELTCIQFAIILPLSIQIQIIDVYFCDSEQPANAVVILFSQQNLFDLYFFRCVYRIESCDHFNQTAVFNQKAILCKLRLIISVSTDICVYCSLDIPFWLVKSTIIRIFVFFFHPGPVG